ncbi:hypothetical protein EMCRGX_G011589 [Ephydatia muelleri]
MDGDAVVTTLVVFLCRVGCDLLLPDGSQSSGGSESLPCQSNKSPSQLLTLFKWCVACLSCKGHTTQHLAFMNHPGRPVYLLPRTWCSLRGNPRDPKVVSPSGSVPYDVGINLSCGSDPHDRLIPVSCSIEEVVLDHPRKGLSHHGYFMKVKLKRLPQDIAFLKILPTSSPVHSHSHQKLFGHPSGPQSSPYPSQCRALGVSTTSDSDQSDYLPSLLKKRLGTSSWSKAGSCKVS